MPFVNVRLDLEVIQFQKLVVNWLMHVHNVLSQRFVNSHQPVTSVNVHKATLAIQKRRDASQLDNAVEMLNVQIVHDV